MMQAWAWEYVDRDGIAWRILGQTTRVKNAYCIRGDEFAGAFDPDQPSLVEDGISRWPEVVRAKWRDDAYKRYGEYKQQLQRLKDQLQSTPGSALLLLSISYVEEDLAYWEPIIESMPSDLTS